MRKLVTVVLVCGALAGCSTGALDTTSTTARQPAHHARHRHHPRARHPRRRHRVPPRPRPAPAPPPAPLSASHASADTVQPQPPPGSCHARGSGVFSLPDPRCTPGAVAPGVTQANIQSTICVSGYSESVRPPESVTEPEKYASMDAYGDSGSARDYEYDHLVSLELGGAPNDPRNLWPEPGATPNPKDELENRLHDMLCAGQITLAAAQLEIARDWVSAYRLHVG